MLKSAKILLAMLIAVLSHVNCAEIRLSKEPMALAAQVNDLGFKASICPETEALGSSSANFLFIIDMSASNVGAWYNKDVFWYWDASKATDPAGNRFAAVEYFLDNCGKKPNAKFAVMGFSAVAGQLANTGANANTLSCANMKFTSAAEAKAELAALRATQVSEGGWYTQWTESTNNYLTATAQEPDIVRGTSYTNALKCANQAVTADLTQEGGSTAEDFQLVFISDGSPHDEKRTGCEIPGTSQAQKDSCYLQSVHEQSALLVQSANAMGKDLRIYGIFYGVAEDTVPAAMASMAAEGGTGEAMSLATFSGAQDALCRLVGAKLNVVFKPDSMIVLNLTSIAKRDKVYADSDMDGVTDEEERRLGSDAMNPRSRVNGVLDGICARLGGFADCQTKRGSVQCNPNLFKNFLTDCDLQVLNLSEDGLDQDQDSLIDFIEILKGTDPTQVDSGFDPDGDKLASQAEITLGQDPFAPNANILNKNLNQYSTQMAQSTPGCSAGGWQLAIQQVQVSSTMEVKTWPKLDFDLNHRAGEQVIWIGYRLIAINGVNQPARYFGKILKTQQLDETGKQTITEVLPLGVAQYFSLGKLAL